MISILIFLAVLSLLVFVHELGHFVAAKACGIYVDRFSIGMPPRVFGIKFGETDYCVSALPIGGYVKMAGQEDAPLSDEEREKEYGHVPSDRWFNNKPVWQRCIVLVAGPAMNFVLAVLLYGVIAFHGAEVPESDVIAQIGAIESGMPATTAPLYRLREGVPPEDYQGAPDATGWQTGDIIEAVDGKPMHSITDLIIAAVLGGGEKTYYVQIRRTEADGSVSTYLSPAKPKVTAEENRPRFGVAPYRSALVDRVLDGHPAKEAGLLPKDQILRADGEPVDASTLIKHVEKVPENGTVRLQVLRDGKLSDFEMKTKTIGRIQGLLAAPKDEKDTALEVFSITDDLKKATGLQRRDRIVSIDGEAATAERLHALEMKSPGGKIHVAVERPAVLFGFKQKASRLECDIPVSPAQAIGIAFAPKTIFQRLPLREAILDGFSKSYTALEQTVMTIKGLITRTLSPSDLGGPVMIYDVTTKAATFGLMELLRITAFISINLCVLNLLPIPVLDGGQMVVQSYEAVFRKPMSLRIQERFQQAGLVFVVGLMLFVTWNDILRMVKERMP